MIDALQEKVKTIAYLLESVFHRVVGGELRLVNRDRKQLDTAIAFENFQGIFDDLQTCFPWNPLPGLLSSICHDACVKFYIFRRAKVQGLYEFINMLDQMEYLSLEYGNAAEDEILLIRIFDRAGTVDIEEVHIFLGRRLLDKKSRRVWNLSTADREFHSPPDRKLNIV